MFERKQVLDLLQPLLEPITEGVIITDRNGMLLTCNHAVYDLFGLDRESGPINITDMGGHNLRTSLIRAGLEEENGDRHHCEMSVEFDDKVEVHGELRWIHIDSRLVDVPCADGDQLRMTVLRDVTAEKRLFAAMGAKDACGIATEDPDLLRVIERLNIVSGTDASVLIQGESGTGKTEFARLVHQRSQRKDEAFVEVNCGSIPASLIESELFGHVKGAFTGAVRERAGRFKSANGGTLFLDEISELPKELQPQLLRVLNDGQFEAVGSDKTQTSNVRIVCASNRPLRDMVDDGSFRADLYYRLAVVSLVVPPLRERPGDIPLLVEVLKQRLALRGYPTDVRFNADAMRAVMNYPWPGNVRELANAVEHALICAQDGVVDQEGLPDALKEYCTARTRPSTASTPTQDEREQIEKALHKANGNKTLAAQILGVDRSTLWRRMQRMGMD